VLCAFNFIFRVILDSSLHSILLSFLTADTMQRSSTRSSGKLCAADKVHFDFTASYKLYSFDSRETVQTTCEILIKCGNRRNSTNCIFLLCRICQVIDKLFLPFLYLVPNLCLSVSTSHISFYVTRNNFILKSAILVDLVD